MHWLDPLDTAMLAADVVSNPLNIGAVLILSPPPDAGPGYVDELFREGLAGRDSAGSAASPISASRTGDRRRLGLAGSRCG